MVKNFEEPALTLSKDGLRIASADVSAALEKKNLSASLITGLEGCHARWLFDTFVSRDLVAEEPDNAARRGSLFHKVMEDFFAIPPAERTKERLNAVVNSVLQGEFKDMLGYPEAMQWLKQAIRNYYDMGARPERVKVARIPEVTRDGRPYEKNGLEIFVKGNIGGTKRDILGFIDRLVVDQRRVDEALIIEDWKTGAKVKRWKAHTKSTDGLGETRQQVIYSMLLEQRDLTVSGARLIYPVAKEIVDVNLRDEEFKDRVVEDVKHADAALDVLQESNEFAFTPGFLCSWCALVNICPSADRKGFDKAVKAREQQPSPDILKQAIEVL